MNPLAGPAVAAAELEQRRHCIHAGADAFCGFAVTGLRFQGGDVLSVRRATASSLGPPFVSVGVRRADGSRVLYTNVAAARSDARYARAGEVEVREDDVEIRWTGPRELAVSVRSARLKVAVRLYATRSSRTLSALCRVVPHVLWQYGAVAALMSRAAAWLLGADRLAVAGAAGGCYQYSIRPAAVWLVHSAAAVLDGRDLGPLAPRSAWEGAARAPGVFVAGGITLWRLNGRAAGG